VDGDLDVDRDGGRAVCPPPHLGLALARHVWAPPIIRVCGVRLEVHRADRLDPRRAWFLACNHESFGDIPILFGALPVDLRFVAKQELRAVPFLGWYMEAMGMVFVERRRRSSGVASVDATTALLRSGASVVSFPAGTRRRGRERLAFKAAAFAPALAAEIPVVPVAVYGTQILLPPGARLRPGSAHVTVGEPIPTAGLPVTARDEVARRAEASVADMLSQLERVAAAASLGSAALAGERA
jgi:1-acyl-sn-glycerol-3-phosphate acyltransferase